MFRIHGTVQGKKKGVRYAVYKKAEDHVAYYVNGSETESIFWDDDVLQVHLLFKSETEAAKFGAFLNSWDHTHGIDGVTAACDRDIAFEAPIPTSLKRVVRTDYKVGEADDSPTGSLQDLALSTASYMSGENVLTNSDLFQYQSIEDAEFFNRSGTKPQRCHIIAQSQSKDDRNNDNNVVAMSEMAHSMFDGRNRLETNVPMLALEYAGTGPDASVPHRTEVLVNVRFRRETAVSTINFKPGAHKVDSKTVQVSMHVTDAADFQRCLKRKFDETRTVWKDADDGDSDDL